MRPDDEPNLLDLEGVGAERAWRLAHALDLKLEGCQRQGRSASGTFEELGPWLLEALGARGLALRLCGVEGDESLVRVGVDASLLQDLATAGVPGVTKDGRQAVARLVVGDQPLGWLAATWAEAPGPPGARALLEVAGQELDNVLYEYRRARRRHHTVLEIERRLKGPVLERTVDGTARFVSEQAGFKSLVVAYARVGEGRTQRDFRVYERGALVSEGVGGDGSPLGRLLAKSRLPTPEAVAAAAGLDHSPVAQVPVETGLATGGGSGFIVGVGPSSAVGGPSAELLELFGVALGQRLVDHHKEQRYLSQFFGGDVIARLLGEPRYQRKFLAPRPREMAILFTDITSFTTITEQILDGPAEVAALIEDWSRGVVDILFRHGGMFDKMVGDCVIGLFGPPFDEWAPGECVARAVQAAFEVRDWTMALRGSPAVEKIRASSLVPGLGVATGVNVGRVMAGAMGPNGDFTALGVAMNNAARLQGLAGFGEVAVMVEARQALAAAAHPLAASLAWGPVEAQKAKNVRTPLRFHRFVPAKKA